jgi:hypothetical protein
MRSRWLCRSATPEPGVEPAAAARADRLSGKDVAAYSGGIVALTATSAMAEVALRRPNFLSPTKPLLLPDSRVRVARSATGSASDDGPFAEIGLGWTLGLDQPDNGTGLGRLLSATPPIRYRIHRRGLGVCRRPKPNCALFSELAGSGSCRIVAAFLDVISIGGRDRSEDTKRRCRCERVMGVGPDGNDLSREGQHLAANVLP